MTRLALITCLLVLSGCSWFSKDEDGSDGEPRDLESFAKEVDVERVWSSRVGKGAADKAIRLVPAISGSRVFAAAADGSISALQRDNGRSIWRVQAEDFYSSEERDNAFGKDVDIITGGVGIGDQLLAVGTSAGEVLALNQSDGSLAWRSRTTSEVLAPPQINEGMVFVHTIDGKIAAYNALDGEREWLYSTSIPSLSLRGTSTPIVTSDFVVGAFASGRFALLDRQRGLAGFEQRAAIATGRSDLERLVDIDGTMVIVGQRLYVAGYQGSLVAFNINNARIEWMQDASSVVGLGEGFGNIYIGYADSSLGAIDAETGKEVWQIDALLNRSITTPVSSGNYVVVGDYDGYLHVIAQSDGRIVGRRKVDGNGLYSAAVVDSSQVYVMGNSGTLSVFELK